VLTVIEANAIPCRRGSLSNPRWPSTGASGRRRRYPRPAPSRTCRRRRRDHCSSAAARVHRAIAARHHAATPGTRKPPAWSHSATISTAFSTRTTRRQLEPSVPAFGTGTTRPTGTIAGHIPPLRPHRGRIGSPHPDYEGDDQATTCLTRHSSQSQFGTFHSYGAGSHWSYIGMKEKDVTILARNTHIHRITKADHYDCN
jgi:hypothetical protein